MTRSATDISGGIEGRQKQDIARKLCNRNKRTCLQVPHMLSNNSRNN